jgi:hypothetical protein
MANERDEEFTNVYHSKVSIRNKSLDNRERKKREREELWVTLF